VALESQQPAHDVVEQFEADFLVCSEEDLEHVAG
jgi:hypothetical protein